MALAPRLYEFIANVSWESARPQLLEMVRDVVRALSGQLTIGENMRAELRTVRVTAGAPLVLATAFTTPPAALVVLRCRDSLAPSTDIGVYPWVDWDYAASGINVRAIAGLTAGRQYDVLFWVVGG